MRIHARHARARVAAAALGVCFCIAAVAPARALAGPGSGIGVVTPSSSSAAGSSGTWTITYTATEDFARPEGGVVTIIVPAGWTAPQVTDPAAPGYVSAESFVFVDTLSVSGTTIRVHLGAPPKPRFKLGDSVSILYGAGGGPAAATAQTSAPASATFLISSAPSDADTPVPIASQPYVSVVPDSVASVRIEDGAGAAVGAFALSADQDTSLYLQGYDRFGNRARLVLGSWTALGAIGSLAPPVGTSSVFTATTAGTGYVAADSGAWADSTGLVTVTAGSYAGLRMTAAASATAGAPFAAAVEAVDSDGNPIGSGASAVLVIVAYADSVGVVPADPDLAASGVTLSGGAWSGTLEARSAGIFYLAARDTASAIESSPRAPVAVSPAVPDRMTLLPDTVQAVAGGPAALAVILHDAYGNRAPVAADEVLTLWTDRPTGRFEDLGGSPIFEVTVPSGADSAAFRFVDLQSTASAGRVRAIDANGAAPFLGTAGAAVVTSPNAPSGAVALAANPATLTADGSDSALVTSGVIRDAYGNAVAAGERFGISGVLVSPLADADSLAPGAQVFAGAGGTVSVWVRAGVAKGAGLTAVLSERGSASGTVPIPLVAGAPAGAIAIAATPDSVAADSVSTRSVGASGLGDANGNGVDDGEPYTVAATLGSIVTADSDAGTPGVQVLASGGDIAFELLGGDSLGTSTVTAASVRGSATGSADVRVVPGAVSAARSSVTAQTPAAVGPVGSVITVTLRDSRDHPLPAVPADSFAVTVVGVSASVVPLAASTDAAGAIDFRATATFAAPGVVGVTARGVLLLDTPGIDFEPGPLDHFVISGPAGPLVAGAPETLQVSARDAFGNPLPARSGDVLRPSAVAGAASMPDSVALVAGAAAVPFTPSLAAPLAIEVRDDSSHAAVYGPVGVLPGAPLRLVAVPPAPDTLAAGDSVAVRARLFDAQGNAVAGGLVDAAVVSGGGGVSPSSDATDPSGYADFTLRAGPSPGLVALRMAAAGSAADDSVRSDSALVTVIPAGAASVEVAAGGPLTAGDSLDVTVTLRDAFGNVAAGATPSLWLRTTTGSPAPDHVAWLLGPGASGALTDSAGSDGARYDFSAADQGTAVLRLRDTLVETLRVRVSGAALPAAESGMVTVLPAAPASIAVASGDGQSGVVDRELAQPLRVQVRDAFGNSVPGGAVAYRVVTGNGSVDAVRGGAPDSIVIADAFGIAACEVVRLGTTAGPGSDSYRAGLPAAPGAEVFFTASAAPDTVASLTLSPGALALAAGGTATVTVTARDPYGNAAPGTAVTFYLGAPALGSLESLGGTSGGAGSQSGTAGATGTLAVRYRAPLAAPAADSIFARGVSIGPVGIRASVGSAATASLRVVPDSTSWIAGAPVNVRVQALDAFGNLVPSDTATVVMRPSGTVVWSPEFGPMVAGEFLTSARDTVAETVSIGADRVGGGAGVAGQATVRAALPAGAVAIAATRDTLTADGRSAATVTLGPLRDAYGNLEPAGTLVLVSAASAGLLAPDASPLSGLDLATGADGRASLVLIAPASPGADTLFAASRAGSASGSRRFTFVPPPTLSYAAGSIAPAVVVPGSSYAFRLAATNTGSGSIRIEGGTTLSFGSGADLYAALLSAPVVLAPGATDTLRFGAASVSATLTPGTYAPALRAAGTDATGEAFDFYLALAGAQVHVAGIGVAAAGVTPSPVPRGYADLTLVFDVQNPTALAASIDAASLLYTAGSFVTNSVTPALPAALPAGSTVPLRFSVRVPSSGIAPGATVDARLTATASFGGSSVAGTSGPLPFGVISAARAVAVTGGATPSRYLRARTFAPTARIANTGTAGITLSRDSTRLLLEHPGGDRLLAALRAATAVAGGDTALLAFDSLAVPAAVARGRYAATLLLSGVEAGQAFADTIPLDPDSVSILDPPILALSAPVSPATVSAGQSRPLTVALSNSGDVAFDLDPATTLDLGAPVSTVLPLGSASAVPPGGTVALVFAGAPLGSAAAPGLAAATLGAVGFEDGRPRSESIAAGTLDARPPAALAFVAGSASPDTVRAGQSYDLSVQVRNGGGSPVTLDPASSRLLLTDGVEQVVALGSGAPVPLAPGAATALSFPAAAFPAALASQPYPVALVLYASEWALPESVSILSPPGEILVREAAPAVQVRAIDAGAPVQVAPGAAAVTVWGLEVTPLVPVGGVTSARLTDVRLTVLLDGAAAAAPGAAVATLALRDPAGALLAQSAAGSGNPVSLPLPAPVALTSGPESLYVELSLQSGAAAQSVALRLAAGTDLVVLDDLTSLPVPVTGGGGLAFTALTSPPLTIFAKPHGYPNPFHAGDEAVRLSYRLAQAAAVKVTIYTLLGDLVREISIAAGSAGGSVGLNEVPWDGRNGNGAFVVPGVYVARIEGGGLDERIKVGVLR